MAKDKISAGKALDLLISKNIEIVAIVGPDKPSSTYGNFSLKKKAKQLKIRFVTDSKIYDALKLNKNLRFLKNVDLVISFLYWKKIRPELINFPKLGCINFHPAPLPDFRGVAGYSIAILENLDYWGVSAHFIDEEIDTGDIIKVKKFKINSKKETSFSLEQKTQVKLLELFQNVINQILIRKKLPRKKQNKKKGKYISKKYFENQRIIKNNDTSKTIERKIRAFWYPPFPGASIIIKNEEYTVINNIILKDL